MLLEVQDFFTLMREEERKKKDLMDKLVKIMDSLCETESIYKELTPQGTWLKMKRALLNSTFQFSSMYRSLIPKPNKPGELRAVTQANKAYTIVMDALSQLLKIVFEEIFWHQSD